MIASARAAVRLEELVCDPSLAARLSAPEREALLRQLAALILVLTIASAAEPKLSESTNGDTMLTVEEVADMVRQERAWVWRRARRKDWATFVTRPSRKILLVRREGLLRWLASRGAAR